jgi:ROS/MUCR transcriptional regulator protein
MCRSELLEERSVAEFWSLPFDYPMVAANYAAQRSELARKLGLGQLPKKGVAAPPPPASVSKRKGGRPRKVTA